MKKRSLYLLVGLLVLTGACTFDQGAEGDDCPDDAACERVGSDDDPSRSPAVSLAFTKHKGSTPVFTVKNETEHPIEIGADYSLERRTTNGWKTLPRCIFPSIGLEVRPSETSNPFRLLACKKLEADRRDNGVVGDRFPLKPGLYRVSKEYRLAGKAHILRRTFSIEI